MACSNDGYHLTANLYVNGRQIVRTGDKMWMNWRKPGQLIRYQHHYHPSQTQQLRKAGGSTHKH